MKLKYLVILPVLFLTAVHVSAAEPAPGPEPRVRRTRSFDEDWRFLKADAPGAEKPEFKDNTWRRLSVPHDWSIEGPFAETNKTGGAGGFLPSGVGWYRKTFQLSLDDAKQRFFIEFDGVMANSDVWINGVHLGRRPYGYVSFVYDLTGRLNFGNHKTNVIAVRADNSGQPASRWYSGAGIYRHVRLVIANPTLIETWGTFISTPDISDTRAVVRVQNTVTNADFVGREVALRIQITDPAGTIVQTVDTEPQVIGPGTNGTFSRDVVINSPQRWDLHTPNLYKARVSVRFWNKNHDDDEVSFGIRDFQFAATNGFSLNGRNFKIYGVCLHHDGSAFGAAVPLGVWEHRLTQLRKLGVNAIRTAHNPPAPEFLDLFDRMGFLVMDEFFDCWSGSKNPFDYHRHFHQWSKQDTRDTIRRDRNHPSIILYSVGNEIRDTVRPAIAKGILKGLVDVCHETDPTRPVTQGLFRPNVSGDYTNGLADMLDVIGTNYRDNELLAAQAEKPSRKIVGTEQRHDRQTWLWLRDNPTHAGQFLWTGVDYLGESRRWPIVAAGSGLLDRTGTPRPLGYERKSWWVNEPVLHIVRRTSARQDTPADPGFAPLDRRDALFADWTPYNLEAHQENVEIYSNCEEVELFLNGKSLGSKTLPNDASPRNWEVFFEKGKLRAVGKNGGKIVASQELRTAGNPAKIVLTPSREAIANVWDDVSFVTATVVDSEGVVVPAVDDLITFKVSGPAVVAAVDNGNNASHEPFQAGERRAYRGECVAILKATSWTGKITVNASAPGLQSGSVTLKAIETPEW